MMVEMGREQKEALVTLLSCRNDVSRQQFRTLKGQIIAGDAEGARKGLDKILKRNKKGTAFKNF